MGEIGGKKCESERQREETTKTKIKRANAKNDRNEIEKDSDRLFADKLLANTRRGRRGRTSQLFERLPPSPLAYFFVGLVYMRETRAG